MNQEPMNALDAFWSAFEEFVANTGREGLDFDDDGFVAIPVGNDVIVNLALDNETETVMAFATIGIADPEEDEGLAYLQLLRAHAYWKDTRGFVVGLEDDENGRLVLQDRRSMMEFPDGDAVAEWVGACVQTTRELRNLLADPHGESGEEVVFMG